MKRKQQIIRKPCLDLQSSILNSRYPIRITFSVILLSLFIGLLNYARAEDDKNPYTGNQEAITEGQELYKMFNCYGCHGMQGGGGMGPSLSDEEWKIGDGSDASLMKQLMEGRANMPAYKDAIEKEQAWKIIAFVRTLYKGDPAKVQW